MPVPEDRGVFQQLWLSDNNILSVSFVLVQGYELSFEESMLVHRRMTLSSFLLMLALHGASGDSGL
jgi:hypothetical protein